MLWWCFVCFVEVFEFGDLLMGGITSSPPIYISDWRQLGAVGTLTELVCLLGSSYAIWDGHVHIITGPGQCCKWLVYLPFVLRTVYFLAFGSQNRIRIILRWRPRYAVCRAVDILIDHMSVTWQGHLALTSTTMRWETSKTLGAWSYRYPLIMPQIVLLVYSGGELFI